MLDILYAIADSSLLIDVSLLLSAATILVSLYIPVAILVFQDVTRDAAVRKRHQDSSSRQKDDEELPMTDNCFERNVLLNVVLEPKKIFTSAICMVTCPLVISVIQNIYGRTSANIYSNFACGLVIAILLAFFLYSIYTVICNLIQVYKWLIHTDDYSGNSYRQKFRKKYLQEQEWGERCLSWSRIWNNMSKENVFFMEYAKLFFEQLKKANDDYVYRLGYQFIINFSKYDYNSAIFYKELLSMHDFSVKRNHENEAIYYFQNEVIEKSMEMYLSDKSKDMYFSLFEQFDKQVITKNDEENEQFDKQVITKNDEENLLNVKYAVYKYLSVLARNYEMGRIDENSRKIHLDLPKSWNLCNILDSQSNSKCNAIGVLEAFRDWYIYDYSDKTVKNEKQNELLKMIMWMLVRNYRDISVRVVQVLFIFFYTMRIYPVHESKEEARVYSFINRDYGFLFEELLAISITTPVKDDYTTAEGWDKALFDKFHDAEQDRVIKTVKMLRTVMPELRDYEYFLRYKNAVVNYNTKKNDENMTDIRTTEYNLARLKETFIEVDDVLRSIEKSKK